MTQVLQQAPPTGPSGPATSRRTRIGLVVGLAVAVVAAATTIGIVLSRGGTPAEAQQLTSIQQACQQWSVTYTPSVGSGPTASWCTGMTDWMRQELRSGHMTGPMMWSDPSTMRATCRQWMATRPSSASGIDPQVCDQMVSWMAQHAGNWGTWMMSSRMMGL